MYKPDYEKVTEELINVLNTHCIGKLTYTEIMGVLEQIKLEVWNESGKDQDTDLPTVLFKLPSCSKTSLEGSISGDEERSP